MKSIHQKFAENLQIEVKAKKLKEDKKLVGPMLGRSYDELKDRVEKSPAYLKSENEADKVFRKFGMAKLGQIKRNQKNYSHGNKNPYMGGSMN